MVNHRRRQHFLGQRQELLGEVPDSTNGYSTRSGTSWSSDWPTRRGRDAAAAPAGLDVELAPDAALALAALEHDEVLGQPLAIVVEALHLHGPAGAAARGQEPVPVGDGAGPHVLHQRRPARWPRAGS